MGMVLTRRCGGSLVTTGLLMRCGLPVLGGDDSTSHGRGRTIFPMKKRPSMSSGVVGYVTVLVGSAGFVLGASRNLGLS